MPDVVGAAPQPDVLQVPNNVYRKPENPLNSLRGKTVQGVQDMVVNGPRQNVAIPVAEPQPQQVAVYNADSPQEATGGSESDYSEQVAPTPQPEIKGSPYARIRVLERERALERKRADETAEQLALLAKVIDKAGIMQEEEFEEEEPTDPISRLERKQDATLKEINDFKESIKTDRALIGDSIANDIHLDVKRGGALTILKTNKLLILSAATRRQLIREVATDGATGLRGEIVLKNNEVVLAVASEAILIIQKGKLKTSFNVNPRLKLGDNFIISDIKITIRTHF